jgi:hypothetical protein
MDRPPEAVIDELCRLLEVNPVFLDQCLRESVIELRETEAGVELGNATLLRMRRLERLCHTFDVDLSVALLLTELAQRIEALEKELRTYRSRSSRGL